MTIWHGYHVAPIDLGWNDLLTVDAYVKQYVDAGYPNSDVKEVRQYFTTLMARIEKVATESLLWEGDFREVPHIFHLPTEIEFSVGIVFKQDNNGSTFLFSPVELPWIKEEAFKSVQFLIPLSNQYPHYYPNYQQL